MNAARGIWTDRVPVCVNVDIPEESSMIPVSRDWIQSDEKPNGVKIVERISEQNRSIPDKERQRRNTVKNKTKAQIFKIEVMEFVMECVNAAERGTDCIVQLDFEEDGSCVRL